MKNDDFAKQLTAKLDQAARQHRNKAVVIDRVLDEIQEKSLVSRFNAWKMTGFALAAAIAGFVIVPNSFDVQNTPSNQQVVVSPKLSPQMMEDLEMLSVFGEDTTVHGS